MDDRVKKVCNHCHMDIEIRNPSGFCDHLYYPEECEVCRKAHPTHEDRLRAEIERLSRENEALKAEILKLMDELELKPASVSTARMSTVETLKAELSALRATVAELKNIIRRIKTTGRHWCLNAPGEKEIKECFECDVEAVIAAFPPEPEVNKP